MKTTRIFSVLLLSAAVFASCSKDTPEPVGGTESGTAPIQFFQSGKVPTRGAPYMGEAIEVGESFHLYAYRYAGGTEGTLNPAYINEAVEVATNATGSATFKGKTFYWPANPADALRFQAYYPTSLSTAVTFADGNMSLNNYSVGNTWVGQTDVLYASTANLNHNTKVKIHFQHALARVTVQFRLKNAGAKAESHTVRVSEIKLDHIYNRGDFVIGGTSSESDHSGRWTVVTTPATMTADIEKDAANPITAADTDLTVWNNPLQVDQDKDAETDAVESFFVLPMTNPHFETAGTTLDIKAIYNDGDTDIEKTGFVALKTLQNGQHEWLSGYHYNYQFNIDLESNDVEFDQVSVQKWVYTPIEVN